ncbi:MAG: hypothetical protein H9W81_18460 [Enterococcus sp.]|nr:hypothetical protein [Enterococcus sp.]
MGIFNRTKGTENNKVLTIEDMRSQLISNSKTIETELDRVTGIHSKTEETVTGWEVRVAKVNRYIDATTDSEALEALNILKAQAENFLEEAKLARTDDKDYVLSLKQNKEKIAAALNSLEAMEKKEALHQHLRSVAEGLNNKALTSNEKSIAAIQDDKLNDIRRLIHTTEALIEIRSTPLQIKS